MDEDGGELDCAPGISCPEPCMPTRSFVKLTKPMPSSSFSPNMRTQSRFANVFVSVPKIRSRFSRHCREPGVRHILEGSVRKAGSTVRITAQLIVASTDQHLWSQSFDRPMSTANLFADRWIAI